MSDKPKKETLKPRGEQETKPASTKKDKPKKTSEDVSDGNTNSDN